MEEPERRQIDSWQAAEHNARDWMRAWGYKDAKLTPPGADAGLDVQASKAVAQVKWEASQVGRPALQRLFGARGLAVDKELLFFTGAKYSDHAEKYAADMDIALFKYSLDGQMTAVNEPAQTVVTRAAAEAARSGTKENEEAGPAGCIGCGVLILAAILFLVGMRIDAIEGIPEFVVVGAPVALGLTIVGLSLFLWLSREGRHRPNEQKQEVRPPKNG